MQIVSSAPVRCGVTLPFKRHHGIEIALGHRADMTDSPGAVISLCGCVAHLRLAARHAPRSGPASRSPTGAGSWRPVSKHRRTAPPGNAPPPTLRASTAVGAATNSGLRPLQSRKHLLLANQQRQSGTCHGLRKSVACQQRPPSRRRLPGKNPHRIRRGRHPGPRPPSGPELCRPSNSSRESAIDRNRQTLRQALRRADPDPDAGKTPRPTHNHHPG